MRSIQEIEIEVLSEILRFMQENAYEDKDDFASKLAKSYVESLNSGNATFFQRRARSAHTNFFKANRIEKTKFIESLYKRLSKKKINLPAEAIMNPPLLFNEIFPEIKEINNSKLSNIEQKLNIEEEIIQAALRDALREKGASPITRRGKDSALEVADLEHFYMLVKNKLYSFSAVVKGYNSISGNKLAWKDVAHQVMKANRTKPNYILFLTAKEPKDGVISEIATYGSDVKNPHLVIFVPPSDLARFLVWRKIII